MRPQVRVWPAEKKMATAPSKSQGARGRPTRSRASTRGAEEEEQGKGEVTETKEATDEKEAALKKKQHARAVANYVYAEFCDQPDDGDDPHTAEYVRATRQALRRMGARVPTGRRGESLEAQKAAACQVMRATRADVLGEDEKLPGADEAACLVGRNPGEIAPDRLIRLRVAPDKTRWRCYDVLDIQRRIANSHTFAAHFSPYQRARIASQAEFLEPSEGPAGGSSTSTAIVTGAGSTATATKPDARLQPCAAYSGHRTVCARAAPRCTYNTRTLVGDLLRRSTSHYADKECHPVVAYVRQLAAACSADEAKGERGAGGDRTEHLRLVLIDILTRAIHKNHRPSVDAATGDEVVRTPRTDEQETEEVVAESEPAGASRSDAIVARYELELSVARMQRDLARRLAHLGARELCRLLHLNLQWYLDDTQSVYERQWAKVRGAVHSIVSPFYVAAAASGEAFLELLGWNYIPLAAMRRAAKFCVYLVSEASRRVLARTHAKPQVAWHHDADVGAIEREWTAEVAPVADVLEKGGSGSGSGAVALREVSDTTATIGAGEPYLRTLHFVTNSTLGVYSTAFASYGAYFLLTPGGWVILDKIRRNPSLAAVSGLLLSVLLDQAAADPLALLSQLGLPPLVFSTLTKTVTEAVPLGANLVGLLAGELTAGAPNLGPLLKSLGAPKRPAR